MGSSIVGIQAEDLENQESEEEHWVFSLRRSLQPLTASAMVEGKAGRGHFMRGEGVSTLNLQKMLKAP